MAPASPGVADSQPPYSLVLPYAVLRNRSLAAMDGFQRGADASRRIPLSVMGILQYIAPTLQFLLGVIVYREPFTQSQFVGFAFVWAGLIIFGAEGLFVSRTR
jgi:EamA domain-containing membrane protein RarD